MLDKRKIGIISYISLFASLSALANAQTIDSEPRDQIVVEAGQRAVFLCRYGEPIFYCRISVPGIETLNLSPDWSAENGFGYYGEGLKNGQCGVAIESVSASANGEITCHLGIRGKEIKKSINLVVAVAPDTPQIAVSEKARNNNLEVNEEFIAECVARGGRPAANISFYLDDEPIEQHGQQQEVHEKIGRDNTTTYEASHTISWNLRATDNGRMLICRAFHFAYPNNYSDVSTQIVVNYRPQPLPEVRIYGLVLQTTSTVNVTISSNPRPRIEWIIDGTSIPQGAQNGRYEAYQPIDLGRGEYNVTLSIAGLNLEDTTKIYRLRASNNFGVQEYVVRISSSEAVPDTGLGIGAIITIIAACIVLLVAIVLVIVARLTGRWCFADRSAAHSKASETSDTESVDVKPLTLPTTDEKKKPFTKLFFRKPKTSDTELVSSNKKEGDTNVQQKSNDDVEKGEAKDNGKLVYAELQLKTVVDPPAVAKETTEYAEILYVTPTVTQDKTDTTPAPVK